MRSSIGSLKNKWLPPYNPKPDTSTASEFEPSGHEFVVEVTRDSSRQRRFRVAFTEAGTAPRIVLMPNWTIDAGPVLLLTYQLGAEDQVLEVLAISPRGLRKIQRIEADGIDIVEYSTDDGNGDIRLFDGLPLAFRCMSWSPVQERIVQQPCKSLPTGSASPG